MNETPYLRLPRRSLLFTPGDSLRKIGKVAQLAVDAVILDLEDAVAPSQKENARRTVATALSTMDFGRIERLVRLNPPTSDLFAADLEAVVESRPDGLVVPKVESTDQIHLVDRHLSAAEAKSGTPPGSIRLFALIETALGVLHVREIAQASPRLAGLLLGAEDLASSLGAIRTRDGWEILYARSAVVTAAAAYGLQAIDTVFLDLDDLEGLEQDATFARQLGFAGKMAIHPRQVTVINRVFSPSAADIALAQSLLQEYRQHLATGSGVFVLDGRMVDMPLVRAAEDLLERARLAGLLDESIEEEGKLDVLG